MKKKDSKSQGWLGSFCGFKVGILLSIVFIILPFGLLGSSWEWWAMAEVDYRVTFLLLLSSVFLVGINKAIVSVVICALILIFSLVGSYIRKLLNDRRRLEYDNETKEVTILGLKEAIRLLEEKINGP